MKWLGYYKKAQANPVFNFNRKVPLDNIRIHGYFDNFGYIPESKMEQELEKLDSQKLNKYRLDGLRYTRRSELKEKFGFSHYEIDVFEGTAHPNLHKPYELYLPKLLSAT
jgi:hypothetical protein